MQRFEMSFRDYLEEHRDSRHLSKMLFMVIEGVRELHELGYVHRDLKPDNIAVNLKPLQVVVIDFDRSTPRT
jgi:serine/threonine protein kinase